MEKQHIVIRKAEASDLDAVAALEEICFPPAEAASRESFRARLAVYPDYFLLLFLNGELVSFVDGFVTNERDLTDELYADASMHDPNGAWQMIFGVNTHPAYRRNGYAAKLIGEMIRNAESEKRKGVVLTCKSNLVSYYALFGFLDEGISEESVHGGAVWHQMRLTF